MICTQCGHDNPAGLALCANCATPLGNFCPNCGFENPRGFKFCGNCGTNLLTSTLARPSSNGELRRLRSFIPGHLVDKILNASKEIEGERRTVTVLFSDVVGFTSISEKLDPEAVYSIINTCVTAFTEEIYAYEGTLDKFMGDGVMALFGAPVMHEDDPARAVRSALGMQAALTRINQEMVTRHGVSLQMRMGLNLGTVVVADIGADLKMNYTALGDTVNVASRLQGVAEPGTILVSRAVYDETRALFEFSELGSIRVKGRVEPVEIYQVLGVKRQPGRARGVPGLAAPMVGRDEELARARYVITVLGQEHRGGVLLITGEAGMGKSRLVSELRQWIARTPDAASLRLVQGECSAYGQSAYDVFVQILNDLCGLAPEDSVQARRDKIQECIRKWVPEERARVQVLPYVENLMGLTPTEPALRDRIRHLEPSQLRQQTFLGVRDLFTAVARQTPLILILEDLHLVDKPSLDLLLFLFNTVQEEPLLYLCVSRLTEGQAATQIQRVGNAALESQFTHLAIEPLSMQESATLSDLLLTSSDLPDSLRQLIPQRAEGNPFYLEEIIRTLIDRNLIRRRGERWELTPGADVRSFQVPRTLEGLIMARIDHLPDTSRYTAQCASVIGRDFADSILLRVAETNELRLENDLQELMDHEVVHQTLQAPERQYAFRHIVTQQTIYHSLLLRRREQLHYKIARAIEQLYPERLEENAERLAFHYSEGKDAIQALPHVIRSGEHAAARYANEQALDYFRTALDLANRTEAAPATRIRILSGLGDSQTHIGDFEGAAAAFHAAWDLTRRGSAEAGSARQAAEIGRRLGRVYERRGNYDEAMQWLECALDEINRDPLSGQAVERVRIYLDIGWVHYRRGKVDQAERWRLRALEISEGLDYYAETGSAYNGLAALYNLKGDWHRAIDYAQRGLQVRERIGDLEGVSRSHSNLGAIMFNLGEWDRALPHLQSSLELKRRIGDAKFLAVAFGNLGYFYLYKGETPRAHALFEAALAHAVKIHDPNATCWAMNALALADMAEGEFKQAAARLESSIASARETGALEPIIEGLTILAEAELGRYDLAAARQAAEAALHESQAHGMKQLEAGALRSLGAVEHAAGEYLTAEAHLRQSQELFDAVQNVFESARSEFELSLLYLDRRQWLQASQLSTHSAAIFERLEAVHYLARARQAICRIEQRA